MEEDLGKEMIMTCQWVGCQGSRHLWPFLTPLIFDESAKVGSGLHTDEGGIVGSLTLLSRRHRTVHLLQPAYLGGTMADVLTMLRCKFTSTTQL